MAATLKPRKGAYFKLPAGHTSKIHLPNGTTIKATYIWVRNNGNGTFHGFPSIRKKK